MRYVTMSGEVDLSINSGSERQLKAAPTDLPAIPPPEAAAARPAPLLSERSDFLDGGAPAAEKVEAFLAEAFAAMGENTGRAAGALVPWICDVLLSNHWMQPNKSTKTIIEQGWQSRARH